MSLSLETNKIKFKEHLTRYKGYSVAVSIFSKIGLKLTSLPVLIDSIKKVTISSFYRY